MNPKIQKSWRQLPHFTVLSFFSDKSRKNYVRSPSQHSTPLHSHRTLHISAGKNEMGGAVQTDFVPRETLLGARNPTGHVTDSE